jgi:triosephosphate isomerase
MSDRTPLMAGNWKMNLKQDEARELAAAIAEGMNGLKGVDVLVAPPFTSLHAVKEALGNARVYLAAQNMYWEPMGAFTGEISPRMLVDAGCTHVIVGHSERRTLFNETSETVDKKAHAADLMGLIPIVCIGETLEEREAEKTFEVVGNQLSGSLKNYVVEGVLPPNTVIAYEPVWAIGTGKTATPEQAQEVHAFIRQWIEKVFNPGTASLIRILYGGSVKPDNVAELMAQEDIDGALVGGASLKADSFIPIMRFRDA